MENENIEKVLSAEDNPLDTLSVEEAAIGAKLLPILTEKISKAERVRIDAKYRSDMEALRLDNQKALKVAIEEMQETAKPLTDDELTKLLSQDYGTFPVKVVGADDKTYAFTIRELAADTEKELSKTVRTAVGPLMKAISSVEWQTLAGESTLVRLEKIVDLVPEVLDVVAVTVAICLDPNKQQSIDGPWVLKNLSMGRMMNILMAQVAAGRYRDFFSLVSRLYQQTRTMM